MIKLTDKDNRKFVDAVLYVLKNGIGWRQIPIEYGNWNSIWRRFNRWSSIGIWNKVFDTIKPELKDKIVAIDSTSIKVHQEGTRYFKKTQKKSK